MLQLIRTNPGILISLALLGGGMFVCALLGLIMTRAGASLRPIYWFAGFSALVVLPQLLGHCYTAIKAIKTEAPRTAALEQLAVPVGSRRGDEAKTNESSLDSTSSRQRPQAEAASEATRDAHAETLFGPDADPQLITDVRHSYGDVFAKAEFAQFAILSNGDTVLLARFNNSAAAEQAWIDYLRVSGLNQIAGQGDSQRGFAVTRPVGDRAYVLHMHTMVGIWTGRDDAAIRNRMLAGGFEIPSRAPLSDIAETVGDTANSKSAGKPKRPLSIALICLGLTAYLFIVVLYFFKGSAWAGTSRAKPGVAPVTAAELATRIEAINALDVPFRVERGAQSNEFIATWRYADAKWVDLARARGLRRTFRIRLTLDESNGTVRATDYAASFDWSAGRGGANIEWKASLGIAFFQYEHQRVLGLQLDEQGRFKPELTYAYTFNLNEMKSPLVETVTRAGWNWRPTVWEGPTWLHWLTE